MTERTVRHNMYRNRIRNRRLVKLPAVLLAMAAALIAALSLLAISPLRTQAEELMTAVDFAVILNDDTQPADLPLGAYTNNRDNIMYLSLRDLAQLLSGTQVQYQFSLDEALGSYVISRGIPYTAPVIEPEPKPEMRSEYHEDEEGNLLDANNVIIWKAKPEAPVRPDFEYLDLYINPLMVDGSEVMYYSWQLSVTQDLYLNPVDIQLLLGITLIKENDSTIRMYTDRGFAVDLAAFEEDGYFDFLNGVVVGDAATGEILFGHKADNVDAIASTSKLMTFLLAARYLETGRIHMEDKVILSDNVGYLIDFGYGILPMYAGQEVMFKDLLAAMMLPSSNEAALAIAEHVAGSEEEFVRLMNETADLLGLTTAKFYNASGLPVPSSSLIASVQENQMSAADLFRLSSALLQKNPGVIEFSSQKKMDCPSLGYEVENSNNLLYNLDNCIGLKTGTTNEAGCCLVAASKVQKDDGEHIYIAIVLGANNNIDRFQVPHLLLTWAAEQ